MKIAIPTSGGILDEYLNICEVFSIFSVDKSHKITDTQILPTPQGCDCKNNIPLILNQNGVTIMLVCNLPKHAAGICKQYGIKVYKGYSGDVRIVIESFLSKNK